MFIALMRLFIIDISFLKTTVSVHLSWLHLYSLQYFLSLAMKLCPEDVTAADIRKVKCCLLQIAFPALLHLVNSAWEHFPKADCFMIFLDRKHMNANHTRA